MSVKLETLLYIFVSLKTRLTYGKQTIKNPWLLGKIYKLFRDAFRSTLIHTAKGIVGDVSEALPPIVPAVEIISRPNLDLPFLSIKKEPREEIEVIALFYELIGRGYLREYETWGLTTRERYDGKMLIQYPNISITAPRSDRDLNAIEFKVYLSDLVDDFEKGRKRAEDINFIIVWVDDFIQQYPKGHVDFEVINIEGTELESYAVPRVEKCLHARRTGTKIQILELKSIVEGLKEK